MKNEMFTPNEIVNVVGLDGDCGYVTRKAKIVHMLPECDIVTHNGINGITIMDCVIELDDCEIVYDSRTIWRDGEHPEKNELLDLVC